MLASTAEAKGGVNAGFVTALFLSHLHVSSVL